MRDGWVETTLNSFLKQSKLKVKVNFNFHYHDVKKDQRGPQLGPTRKIKKVKVKATFNFAL